MKPFQEFTISGEDDKMKNCEVMVQVGEDGTVIRMYTYRDCVPTINRRKVITKQGANPLFVTIPKLIKTLVNNYNFMICGDPIVLESPWYLNMIKKYDLIAQQE